MWWMLMTACAGEAIRLGPKEGMDSGSSDSPSNLDDSAKPTPWVQILAPADGASVANPVTFEITAEGVATVALDADGYALGDAWDPAEETRLSYTFNGTGYARLITLTGYDADGAAVATDSATVTVDAGEVLLDVPYFDQYNNDHEPGSTCGITSGAMLIDAWHPDSVTPDSLYLTYGKAAGQSPAGLAAIDEAEGLEAEWTTTGTRAEIRAHLDAGRPVVAHGWWTSAGHVVVIIGYSDTDWIVNDPAGDWYTCYGCGGGEAVRYPLGGSWDEAMSTDGDLWYSTASTEAF